MHYTRISNSYLSETVIQNLLSNRSKLVDLQEQISSGKRIQKPSDDVASSVSVLNTKNSLGKIENFLKNISNASSEMETTDTILSTTADTVTNARALVIQALSDSTGPEQAEIINSQLKQYIDQIKTLGNTSFGNKYIFGGYKTDSPPFSVPTDGEIQYTGSNESSYQRTVEISDGVTVPVNVNGKTVFGEYYTGDHDNDPATPDTLDGSGLLKTLMTITNELDKASPDKSIVRTNLANLDNDLSNIENIQSQVGGSLQRLELTKNILEDNKINLKKVRSSEEDLDITKAISDMQFQQTALQASLGVSAQIIQPSLMDYL